MTALVDQAPAAVARATIAQHSKSFALASKLLDARTRDQTAVVYTYCRRADDAVDEAGGEEVAALTRLRTELDEVYDGTPRDPVLRAFGVIARERNLPRSYPEELLAGMAMDVDAMRYTTVAELGTYCFRVAGVVGLMMCHIFGVRDDAALVPAARLGLAMQLTNICRDVSEDWDRGRLYLPAELHAAHGAGGLAGELGQGAPRVVPKAARAAVRATVRDLLDLADTHYRAADRGIPALPWRAALAVRAARRVYSAIGTVIRRRDYDVLAGRAFVPTSLKLAHVTAATARTAVAWPGRAFAVRVRIPTRILTPSDVRLG